MGAGSNGFNIGGANTAIARVLPKDGGTILAVKTATPGGILAVGDAPSGGSAQTLTISGRRTLLLIGADLYIRSNIRYTNKSDMLGIVVLSDER